MLQERIFCVKFGAFQSDPIDIFRYNQAMPTLSAKLIISAVSPLTIGVLAFDGISPFHLSVPALVFGELHKYADTPEIRLRICSAASASGNHKIKTSAGYTLETKYGLSTLRRADIIIIPSWHEDLRTAPDELIKLLRVAHKNGAHIVGLCLGAFVLADAGLLNQREATTHWALTQEFTRRYPQVQVNPDVLYVGQDKITTSAGTAAGIDCCLHLLRTYYGTELATQVARRLVVAPHRQGGQAQYIEQPIPTLASDDRLGKVLHWMSSHLHQAQPLDMLADKALMSRRTFTRHFQQLTGTTVGKWLLHQRLSFAQRQLESGRQSVEEIAIHAGFGSAMLMRRHFSQVLRISPSAYRLQFSGTSGKI